MMETREARLLRERRESLIAKGYARDMAMAEKMVPGAVSK